MAKKVNLKLTGDEYDAMEENSEGVCTACGCIREMCEPDAENYQCDDCGKPKVVGTMIALEDGFITIIEDEDSDDEFEDEEEEI